MQLQTNYSDLLPPCPRIIDPGNPANNLYLSGIKGKENKWTLFARNIAHLNIGRSIMKQHKAYFKQK